MELIYLFFIFFVGKEPELIYQTDTTGLTSMHSISWGMVLDRGWSVSFSGVLLGEKHWVGVGIFRDLHLSPDLF